MLLLLLLCCFERVSGGATLRQMQCRECDRPIAINGVDYTVKVVFFFYVCLSL